MADDLREKIAEALTREHYRRAAERIEASPEEHQAAMADVVMAVVQPELDEREHERDEARRQRDEASEIIARRDAAIARVRRLCDLTIFTSCRVQAIDQAQDTLRALDHPEGT